VLNIVLGDEPEDAPVVALLVLLDEPHPAATSRPVARSVGAQCRRRGLEASLRDSHGLRVMP
jgi:hypothetical protein